MALAEQLESHTVALIPARLGTATAPLSYCQTATRARRRLHSIYCSIIKRLAHQKRSTQQQQQQQQHLEYSSCDRNNRDNTQQQEKKTIKQYECDNNQQKGSILTCMNWCNWLSPLYLLSSHTKQLAHQGKFIE